MKIEMEQEANRFMGLNLMMKILKSSTLKEDYCQWQIPEKIQMGNLKKPLQ